MARVPAGRFCWVDLAAADATRAVGFYTELFGWSARSQAANGGTFLRLAHGGRVIGSLYQMRRAEREADFLGAAVGMATEFTKGEGRRGGGRGGAKRNRTGAV